MFCFVLAVLMIIAATMISPAGLGEVLQGAFRLLPLGFIVTPIGGFAFLIQAWIETPPGERLRMMAGLVFFGGVLWSAVGALIVTVSDYRPAAIADRAGHQFIGYHPIFGLWLAVFSFCIFFAFGLLWSFIKLFGFAPDDLRPPVVTAFVLFGIIVGLYGLLQYID